MKKHYSKTLFENIIRKHYSKTLFENIMYSVTVFSAHRWMHLA